MTRKKQTVSYSLRNWVVLGVMLGFLVLLIARAFYLQVISSDYLQQQGNARYLRVAKDNAVRGMILDRNGSPLAISTPVDSIWIQPETFLKVIKQWPSLSKLLKINLQSLQRRVEKNRDREFMYLKRHVNPGLAQRVMQLDIPGVALQREYRRYYPSGPIAGHLVGFTNIDDQGQEGVELAFDDHLRAIAGKKLVHKDRLGNIVEGVERLSLPIAGKNLTLSIDRRIQYLAYRELEAAVKKHRAKAASAIVLDAHSGEVLAMVNVPAFNPNNRKQRRSALFRNRAVTDLIEPGSTLKPFTIAAALESGKFTANSIINTSPGTLVIGHNTIKDSKNYGWLSVSGVIKKSSNVGAAKIVTSVPKQQLWSVLHRAGFGVTTGCELPGESAGIFNPAKRWVPIDHASLSFGYGISVTPLQLARAYTAFANAGVIKPITILKREKAVSGQRAFSSKTARQVLKMLEQVVTDGGTGTAAKVLHYRVAGKTGTVYKLINGNYVEDRYISLFAGVAPVSDPRLVMLVVVDDPQVGGHFGGLVAAPVFSKVMSGTFRLLNMSPDAPQSKDQIIVKAATSGEA